MITLRPSIQKKRLLLCFSPKDADGKAELVASLAPACESLSVWSIDEAPAGDSVPAAFQAVSAQVDTALLLLSADFFADLSEPRFAEQVAQLRQQQHERGLVLVPIVWRHCDWRAVDWLDALKPLPAHEAAIAPQDKAQRDLAWAEIAYQLSGRGMPRVWESIDEAVPGANIVVPSRKDLIDASQYLLERNKAGFEHDVDVALGINEVPQLVSAQHVVHGGARCPAETRSLDEPLINYLLRVKRLLLVGIPGTGKTQTLRTLCEQLLVVAQSDSTLPVPFLLNLSTFSKDTGTLRNWFAKGLKQSADISIDIGRVLLAQGRVLLLLDGLDEMAAERRAEALTEINALVSAGDPALARCVVCSRTAEYKKASVQLILAAALELQPLNTHQVLDAVDRAGPRLASLRAAIEKDKTLEALLQTPLMLVVAMRAFAGNSDLTLGSQNPDELRKKLYNAYVVQMLSRTNTNSIVPAHLTLRWLRELASYLTRRQVSLFLIEWLQSAVLMPNRAYLVIDKLIFVLVAWLGVGLGIKLFHSLNDLQDGNLLNQLNIRLSPLLHDESLSMLCRMLGPGLGFVLFCVMLSEVGISLFMSLVGRLPVDLIVPIEHMHWSWTHALEHWKSGLKLGLRNGLYIGLVCGLFLYMHSYLLERLGMGLSSGIILVLFWIMVLLNIDQQWTTSRYFLFNQIWRKIFSILSLVFGAALGSVSLLTLKKSYMFDWLGLGLSFGLILGLSWGIIFLINGGWVKRINAQPTQPNEGIRSSIRNGLKVMVSVGVSVGLVTGVATGFALNPASGLIVAIVGFLISGPTGGLLGGIHPALRHYILRLFLWREGKFPLRLVPWLEFCKAHLLLRPLGRGAYMFWHITLQEYFYALDDERLAELAQEIEDLKLAFRAAV